MKLWRNGMHGDALIARRSIDRNQWCNNGSNLIFRTIATVSSNFWKRIDYERVMNHKVNRLRTNSWHRLWTSFFNIIWYIFKDNGKFNPKDCLKAVVNVSWFCVPGGYESILSSLPSCIDSYLHRYVCQNLPGMEGVELHVDSDFVAIPSSPGEIESTTARSQISFPFQDSVEFTGISKYNLHQSYFFKVVQLV